MNDASALIDIQKAGLLEQYSKIGFTLVLPDVVQAELRDMTVVDFEKLGFEVASLDGRGVLAVKEIRDAHAGLSLADTFALVVAEDVSGSVLLTGDRQLRIVAQKRGVEVHGVLWMLDRMFEQDLLAAGRILEVLSFFENDTTVRLPPRLLSLYLQKYQAILDKV